MVTVEDVVNGTCKYIDDTLNEIYPADGLKRLAFGTGAAIYIKNNLQIGLDIAKKLGIYDETTGNVNIDIAKEELLKRMDEKGFTIDKKFIGKMTFLPEDVEKLYEYIVS